MLSEETTRRIPTNYERGCLLASDENLDELALASSRSFHPPVNHRVTGTEKVCARAVGEAVLQLRADYPALRTEGRRCVGLEKFTRLEFVVKQVAM